MILRLKHGETKFVNVVAIMIFFSSIPFRESFIYFKFGHLTGDKDLLFLYISEISLMAIDYFALW